MNGVKTDIKKEQVDESNNDSETAAQPENQSEKVGEFSTDLTEIQLFKRI